MTRAGKNNKVNKVNRPPLTDKAIDAITKYVQLKSIDAQYVQSVIKHTLTADRMKRDKLYDWLSNHGYIWDAKRKRWRLKQ